MRIRALIKRIFKEMLHDKRTLLLMFVGPLLILTLLYFLFQSNSTTTATLGVQNVDATLTKAIASKHVKIHHFADNLPATKVLDKNNVDGVITQRGQKLTLTLRNDNQSKRLLIKQSLQKAQIKLKSQAAVKIIKKQQQAIIQLEQIVAMLNKAPKASAKKAHQLKKYTVTTRYLYGDHNSNFFTSLLPIMIVFIVFFFVFLISGIALLRERTTGTLKRLLATPVKRSEIIIGYLCGYGFFSLLQTIMIVLYSSYAFKIQILGSIWDVLLVNALIALVALCLGLLVSTYAATEFQMMQFIPIVIIPQILFSGIIPVTNMAKWLQVIGHFMPLYYGADAISSIIERGSGLTQIYPDLLIILAFIVVFFSLNIWAMKRYRQV